MTRSPAARRSWLFVGGADEDQLWTAAQSGADVIMQELEDFTAPARRPHARSLAPALYDQWRGEGVVVAVRVNPLAGDGMVDLREVMKGAPQVVLLPKVETPDQVRELDEAVTALERDYGLTPGLTELVPNVETARGMMRVYDICRASPRVTAALVASEDMAASLGAERGKDALELFHVRARFHLECTAAGVPSIDQPYTWTDEKGVEADTRMARRLGYQAKCTVDSAHAAIINRVLTPSDEEVQEARAIVTNFEEAREKGLGRVEYQGSLIELPIYLNARRILERASLLGVD